MKKLIALLLSLIMMFTFVACGSSNNADKDDDDDDKKTVEKADENDNDEDKEDEDKENEDKEEEDVVDEDEDLDYNYADFSDAEDALYEFLDVMYDPDSEEFAMWITEGEGVDSLDEITLIGFSAIASMLLDREYVVYSGDYVDDTCFTFEVGFGVADIYEAADIFTETLEYYDTDELESLSEDEIIAIVLDCIEIAETSYYELDVTVSYDEDLGWYVENQEEIVNTLVEDFQYAFDF